MHSKENIAKTWLLLGENAAQHSLRANVSRKWTDDYKKAHKWNIISKRILSLLLAVVGDNSISLAAALGLPHQLR